MLKWLLESDKYHKQTEIKKKYKDRLLFPPEINNETFWKNKKRLGWNLSIEEDKNDPTKTNIKEMPSVLKFFQMIYHPIFYNNILMASASSRNREPLKSISAEEAITFL